MRDKGIGAQSRAARERSETKGNEQTMSIKSKVLGLGAALALGLGVVAPASAQTTVGIIDVSVTVTDAGDGLISVALINGTTADFLIVPVDAVGDPLTGLVDAGSVTFDVGITGDDKLDRPGGEINVKLGDGSAAGAHLNLTGGDPDFTGSNQADFQIPGRYLEISAMNNPQQAKYTGGVGSSGQIWNGSGGRAPRVAGNADSGLPIYKVGDIYGTFNSDADGCRVTTESALQPWVDACGDPSFGEDHVTKQIAGIYPGSGFVSATHQIQLSLAVPAGVYPGDYEGELTVEETFS